MIGLLNREAVGAGGNVRGLPAGGEGGAFDDDFLGFATQRQAGDDAGGDGSAIEGVQALGNLGVVGDSVAVGVTHIGTGADGELPGVGDAVAIEVGAAELVEDDRPDVCDRPAGIRPAVVHRPPVRRWLIDSDSVIDVG
jgi:hypothetical protein